MTEVPSTRRIGVVRTAWLGIAAAVRARPLMILGVAGAVLALDIFLPPLVLSVARKPWTYVAFNPWLKRLPDYLASPAPWSQKLDFLSGVALFWFSADGDYGAPEWGFAVDTMDLLRFLVTALLVGLYVALWLSRRDLGRMAAWRESAHRTGGVAGAFAGVIGLSTGPCSVMGCGAPVLPVIGLVFAGLSSTTLALLSQISRVSAAAVLIALIMAIAWLAWQVGTREEREEIGKEMKHT
jgi:hypothetical protein